MATKFQKDLQKYAELAVRVGLNLRPGQRLLVRAPAPYGVAFEHAPLVHYVAEVAYKAGARLVDVFWGDEQMELIRFAGAPRDSFTEFPKWKATGPLDYAEKGDAILTISATDPDLLKGQDSELVNVYQDTMWKNMAPYLQHGTSNTMNWCVISAARPSWARKMFPKLPVEKAVAKQVADPARASQRLLVARVRVPEQQADHGMVVSPGVPRLFTVRRPFTQAKLFRPRAEIAVLRLQRDRKSVV